MASPIRLSFHVAAAPDAVYHAWLSGEGHAAMTGADATGRPEVGAEFSAWDGYISGSNLALTPGRDIVQSWSAADFPEGAGPSRLEVHVRPSNGGTEVTIVHLGLPEGTEERFTEGWQQFYITPMQQHFGRGKA